jgi:DNA-directed RNA polymerase subunit RPC12/RpoP
MSFASGKSRESSSGCERPSDARRVDGNAAGGMFSEVFVRDLTTARAKCAGCGAEGMIGALPVYAHGMGTVVRCPKCDRVILRVARTPQHIWLDATGATCIVISRGN